MTGVELVDAFRLPPTGGDGTTYRITDAQAHQIIEGPCSDVDVLWALIDRLPFDDFIVIQARVNGVYPSASDVDE